MRVVSLLPSATEIVYALGHGTSLVGVSHECDFPEDAKTKPKMIEPVFDTLSMGSEQIDKLVVEYMKEGKSIYRVKFDDLKKAAPDLIITQELCDVCAIGAADVLEAVNKLSRPVSLLSLNPHTLKDVQRDVSAVAEALGCRSDAERLLAELDAKANRKLRVLCVEWLKPIMNAGHWLPEMLQYAGGFDDLAVAGKPSTYLDWNRVLKYDPEVVVLMPCGFTTQRTLQEAQSFLNPPHAKELSAVRNGRVYATDGHNYFSRSGPRLFDAIGILAQMLHPELFDGALDPRLGLTVSRFHPVVDSTV
jgi:iron complex transport system substrate-binding protein